MNEQTLTVAVSFEDTPTLGDEVYGAVALVAEAIINRTAGTGYWTGETGDTIEERSGIIMAFIPSWAESSLRAALAGIAARHGQEAIGFTAAPATSTLVFAVAS